MYSIAHIVQRVISCPHICCIIRVNNYNKEMTQIMKYGKGFKKTVQIVLAGVMMFNSVPTVRATESSSSTDSTIEVGDQKTGGVR